MAIGGHRTQSVLFVAAMFVPCAVLIALSVRIVNQDRELLVKRQADDRLRIADQAGKAMVSVLEPVRRDEIRTDLEPGARYRHTETVFVGWTEEGRLVPPWEGERDRAAARCRELIARPGFGPAIRACDRPGIEPADLAPCYRRAIATATHPAQAVYARWLWARALASAGRAAEAAPLFGTLLETGPEITDEDGVPLKLYAAQSLFDAAGQRRIVAAVESILSARPWLPPMSSFMASDVAERLARGSKDAAELRAAEGLRAGIRVLQQAESLQNDFPRIRALLKSRDPGAWAAFGEDTWLVGVDGDPAGSATVFAVRAADVFRRLSIPGALRLTDSREPGGEPLGEAFPGLKLTLAPDAGALPDRGGELQRSLLYLALLLVVAATVFAAYLLWRDLKREMRLSELRSQFVSSVSHELKTPLTAIRMFAETLQMGRCADQRIQAEYLGTIVNECERLSRLVDGVLLFSKAEQGKRTYRLKPMQPAEAVHAAARALDYPLSQRGFRLHVSIDDGVPAVSADRDALEQAVLNLLSNAMKFSGDARDIELGLYRENGDVVVRVADHGVGIAAEEQSRIFEKFYRAPTAENQLIPGTGLGLALVAQTAKAHGGRVAVESALGRGSVFLLRLPAPAAGQQGPEGKS